MELKGFIVVVGVVAAGAGSESFMLNAQQAEAMAFLKGVEHAARLGMQRIIVETDAVNVVSALNGIYFDRSFLGTMFREIRAKMMYDFVGSSVSHCPRACNSVAHTVAAIGLNCNNGPVLCSSVQ